MSITRRVEQVERDRFRAAIAHFAASWHRQVTDPATIATDAARLACAPPPTPHERAFDAALWPVVELTTQRPHEHGALRAALAAFAPYLDLGAGDSPIVILQTLEASLGR